MTAIEAYALLVRLKQPAVSTTMASNLFERFVPATYKILSRLERAGLVTGVKRNLWMIGQHDPLVIAPYIVSPFQGYVSFHTALWRHGLISQIPSIIYVASMGRAAVVETPIATYSVHSMTPRMIGGYETRGGVWMATPEKALVDYLYMGPARSGWFASLPEVEIPEGFDWNTALRWANGVPDSRRRAMVIKGLDRVRIDAEALAALDE